MVNVATDIVEVGIDDSRYPPLLKQIPDAPARLYIRGDIQIVAEHPCVAVVGTRKPTPYGVQVTNQLVSGLANRQVIVSGLAYGIDTLAHEATLSVGGRTVAVLGTGVDDPSIYPAKNLNLAHRILAAGGLLVSEYPPGTEGLKHHFPMRNRIIAGLSEKIIIIEAGEGSGALITAKVGLDYNREILAVPGPITSPMSVGTNWLITQGAQPIVSVAEMIAEAGGRSGVELTGAEELVYKALMSTPLSFDEIIRATGLGAADVNSALTELEMKGMITQAVGGTFVARQ